MLSLSTPIFSGLCVNFIVSLYRSRTAPSHWLSLLRAGVRSYLFINNTLNHQIRSWGSEYLDQVSIGSSNNFLNFDWDSGSEIMTKMWQSLSCLWHFCSLTGTTDWQNLKPWQKVKVDDVSALEPSSKPPVRIVEDSITASATYAMTLVTAWMPQRDLLVPAGTGTWLDWIQCGFKWTNDYQLHHSWYLERNVTKKYIKVCGIAVMRIQQKTFLL
jgi:hypothetical protein